MNDFPILDLVIFVPLLGAVLVGFIPKDRLSTIRSADRILLVRDGRLRELGSLAEKPMAPSPYRRTICRSGCASRAAIA